MSIRDRASDTPIETTTHETRTGGMSNWQRILLLVIGDAIVFLIFSIIGRRSHGEATGLDAAVQTVITATPFAVAWFVVSPFVGAFRRGLEMQPKKMATKTVVAWCVAWPVAMLIRGLSEQRVPPWTFALITLATNTIFLLIWRSAFSLISSRRKR